MRGAARQGLACSTNLGTRRPAADRRPGQARHRRRDHQARRTAPPPAPRPLFTRIPNLPHLPGRHRRRCPGQATRGREAVADRGTCAWPDRVRRRDEAGSRRWSARAGDRPCRKPGAPGLHPACGAHGAQPDEPPCGRAAATCRRQPSISLSASHRPWTTLVAGRRVAGLRAEARAAAFSPPAAVPTDDRPAGGPWVRRFSPTAPPASTRPASGPLQRISLPCPRHPARKCNPVRRPTPPPGVPPPRPARLAPPRFPHARRAWLLPDPPPRRSPEHRWIIPQKPDRFCVSPCRRVANSGGVAPG